MNCLVELDYVIVGYENEENAKDFNFPYMLGINGEWLPMSYEQARDEKRVHELFGISEKSYGNVEMISNHIKDALLALHKRDNKCGKFKITVIEPLFLKNGALERIISKEIEELGLNENEEWDKINEALTKARETWLKPFEIDIWELNRRGIAKIEMIP